MTAVLDAPELVLHEHGRLFSNSHEYDVRTPDGTPLAVVGEEVRLGFLGTTTSSRYVVAEAGRPALFIERPGRWGHPEYYALRPDGVEFGRVRQENTWGAPRLELATRDGVLARLVGDGWAGREWGVTLHADPRPGSSARVGLVAGVHRRPRSLVRALVGADEFLLSTDPALDRDLRALLLVGVVALDGVRDRRFSGD